MENKLNKVRNNNLANIKQEERELIAKEIAKQNFLDKYKTNKFGGETVGLGNTDLGRKLLNDLGMKAIKALNDVSMETGFMKKTKAYIKHTFTPKGKRKKSIDSEKRRNAVVKELTPFIPNLINRIIASISMVDLSPKDYSVRHKIVQMVAKHAYDHIENDFDRLQAAFGMFEFLMKSTNFLVEDVSYDGVKTEKSYSINRNLMQARLAAIEMSAESQYLKLPMTVVPRDWEFVEYEDKDGNIKKRIEGGYLVEPVPFVKKSNKGYAKDIPQAKLDAANAANKTRYRLDFDRVDQIQSMLIEQGEPNYRDIVVAEYIKRDKEKYESNPEYKQLVDETNTAWRVQKSEFDKAVGLYRQRTLAVEIMNAFRIPGERYSEVLYHVHHIDYRGRLFQASIINPQTEQLLKSCWVWADEEELTKDDLPLLKEYLGNYLDYEKKMVHEKISGAEAFDPETYDGGYEDEYAAMKVYKMIKQIEKTGSCMSRHKFERDQTTSACQHQAQLTGCVNTGKMCGLDANQGLNDPRLDMYTNIANISIEKLYDRFKEHSLSGFVNRKSSKAPTMILNYGAKDKTLAKEVDSSIMEQIYNHNRKSEDKISYPGKQEMDQVSNIIVESINEELAGPARYMAFAKAAVDHVAEQGKRDFRFKGPSGMTVAINIPEFEQIEVRSGMSAKVKGQKVKQKYISLQTKVPNSIDWKTIKQGISPQIIHHYDSWHMDLCLIYLANEGIDIMPNFDAQYGKLGSIKAIDRIVRQTWVDMWNEPVLQILIDSIYGSVCKAEDFKVEMDNGDILPLVDKNIDPNVVQNNPYFSA